MDANTQVEILDEDDLQTETLTTLALGEEGEDVPAEEGVTTMAIGEEGEDGEPELTTNALGEEGEEVPSYEEPSDGADPWDPWDDEPWSPLAAEDASPDELDLGDDLDGWDLDAPDAL